MIDRNGQAISRIKKFLSYYRPYKKLLLADLVCAFLVSAIVLMLPLCTRYITNTILDSDAPDALNRILTVGALMLGLVAIYTAANVLPRRPIQR